MTSTNGPDWMKATLRGDTQVSIIDIRGTHGSGKSWIPHKILQTKESRAIGDRGVVLGYSVPALELAIIGRYTNVCGGCDGVGSAEEVCNRARRFAKEFRHVMLEGILVAHTFKRYNELAMELGSENYVFAFLNTPLETCLARVRARRRAKGKEKPLNPNNLIRDWHNIWEVVRGKMKQAGRRTVVLPYKDPMPKVMELLRE